MANQTSEYNTFNATSYVNSVMLQHKWKYFVSVGYYLSLLTYLAFYTFYFLAVPFSYETFGYTGGESSIMDKGGHLVCSIVFFLLNGFLLYQELRQIKHLTKTYFSFYNLFDLTVIFMTVFSFAQMVSNIDGLVRYLTLFSNSQGLV